MPLTDTSWLSSCFPLSKTMARSDAAIKGAASKNELMVVGRAVNSWHQNWDRVAEHDYQAQIIEKTVTRSAKGMSWNSWRVGSIGTMWARDF